LLKPARENICSSLHTSSGNGGHLHAKKPYLANLPGTLVRSYSQYERNLVYLYARKGYCDSFNSAFTIRKLTTFFIA